MDGRVDSFGVTDVTACLFESMSASLADEDVTGTDAASDRKLSSKAGTIPKVEPFMAAFADEVEQVGFVDLIELSDVLAMRKQAFSGVEDLVETRPLMSSYTT